MVLQLRELELKLKQYGNSEMTTNPQDFISRKDHARLVDARINGREADLQVRHNFKSATYTNLKDAKGYKDKTGAMHLKSY